MSDETLEPGDWCDECRTRVASDGECECNQEDDEFDEGEHDPDAPPFPEGWTEVGATTEPTEVLLGDLDGNGAWNEKLRGMTLGPAQIYMQPASGSPLDQLVTDYVQERLSSITIGPAQTFFTTKPVESPVFEAIDRASEDRTIEFSLPLPKVGDTWAKLAEGIASHAHSITKTMKTATETFEMLRGLYAQYAPIQLQVALIGTGKRRHVHPGPWTTSKKRGVVVIGQWTRVEHARARRLYSERLRRDRRRIRKGRAPILRSSTFEMVIPNAQVDVRKAGPEYYGMEVVAHPWVPEDQVYVVDPSILDGYRFTEPKTFDWSDAERRAARYRDQISMYGYGLSPTGRFRTTNYFAQMDAWNREALGIQDPPSAKIRIEEWVDETAGWAPEHGPDVDRWLDDGGADRG